MRAGILAAFAEANSKGGIAGRQLELKSYDDGHEPERAIAHTKTLITQDQVFALIGGFGTPTPTPPQPLATEAGVPLIGSFNRATSLRPSLLAIVVNVRLSPASHTQARSQTLSEDDRNGFALG